MKKLLLVFTAVLLSGCSIFNSDSDGKSFEANIGSKSFSAEALAYQNDVGNTEITIIGRKGEWENSQNISFSIVDFDGGSGKYQVRNPSYYFVTGGDVIVTYAGLDHDSVVSSVTVTSYNASSNKISGSFDFRVVVERSFNSYEPGDEISIKGNFDTVVELP